MKETEEKLKHPNLHPGDDCDAVMVVSKQLYEL